MPAQSTKITEMLGLTGLGTKLNSVIKIPKMQLLRNSWLPIRIMDMHGLVKSRKLTTGGKIKLTYSKKSLERLSCLMNDKLIL